ncbi:MAG: hypothetical protein FWE22_04535 [Firmicutes bacterium]|nr:hypothetical protein [Bacillota bacterium]
MMKKITISLLLILISFLMFGCQFFEVIYAVGNFDERNRDPHLFGPIGFRPPQIEGMRLINEEGFEFAFDFNGEHTFVVQNSEYFVLDKFGNLLSSQPLFEQNILYDKFVFQENGLYGVKDIFFNVLVDAQQNKIEIAGYNTLLVNYEDYAYGLFDLDLNPIYITRNNQDFRVIPPYISKTKSFITYNGFVGFFNSFEDTFVFPRFLSLSNFYNDYAIARDFSGYRILRSCSSEIIVPHHINPIFFNGMHLLALNINGNIEILNRYFEAVSSIHFPNFPRPFIFQNLLFFQFGDVFVFYQIGEEGNIGDISFIYFENVFYHRNFLVLKNQFDEYALFDENLNLIYIFDYISFSFGTMKIRVNYQYYFYEIQ